MKNNHEEKNPLNISAYSNGVNILENDPLEEIFELNMGDFLTEHLINADLASKIGKHHDKNRQHPNPFRFHIKRRRNYLQFYCSHNMPHAKS